MKPLNIETLETEVLDFWTRESIFKKAQERNAKGERFRFIDGPPYTTGAIHLGTAWNKVMKDSVLRYKRMQGFNVRAQPGYDMHGLPIEVKVEEKLKIKNKHEILEKIGMDKFIEECRKYALEHLTPMSTAFKRLGVWMDWENPYMAIDNSYIEGAWWALAHAHKKKLLYEGQRVVTWCWRCATALAKHELDYKTVKENSVFVKFPLKGKKKEFIVIWTTTPWTLPANTFASVHPDFEYSRVQVGDEVWILARNLTNVILGLVEKKFKILETFKGSELNGTEYEHPFWNEVPAQQEFLKKNKAAHKVYCVGDELKHGFVSLDSGSGVVHSSTGTGLEDMEVGKHFNVPPFCHVDENGVFTELAGHFKGLRAKKDDKTIVENLESRGLLVISTPVDHEYPHCWRCKNAVIFRATDQWYLATSTLKDQMLAENKKVQWNPDWAGARWFRDWLENLQDWCISRQRFWGIPLPIWRCDCGEICVVGSRSELPHLDDLHRPWIDKVKLDCKKCRKKMSRVPDVLDVWLDSGAAPWATLPYPENKAELGKWFPMDFIIEGKDQIRGWFNSLMALSMISHKKAPYKRIYMHGFVSDNKGQKMSKSIGNVVAPEEAIAKVGADGWRLYAIGGAKPGEDLRFNWNDLEDSYKALNTLWNTAQFLEYMGDFNPEEYKLSTKLAPEDAWLMSRLNTLNESVTHAFETYNMQDVPALLHEFLVLDLSRWYIKLVRERTWPAYEGKDKLDAFKVLYESLKRWITLAAPVLPFLTEQLYQDVVKPRMKKAPESVHFLDWPKPETKRVNKDLETAMNAARSIVEASRFAREDAKVKQRWPLQTLHVESKEKSAKRALKDFEELLKAQANVKHVKLGKGKGVEKDFELGKIFLDTKMTDELRVEALAREAMRAVQSLRKKAGLKVEEQIELTLSSDNSWARAALEKSRRELVHKVGVSELHIQPESPKTEYGAEIRFEKIVVQASF